MSKPRTPAGRHPANVVSLVAGLIFCGIALFWLLIMTGVLSTSDLGWIVPGLLVAAGAVGVIASISRASRASRSSRSNRKGERR